MHVLEKQQFFTGEQILWLLRFLGALFSGGVPDGQRRFSNFGAVLGGATKTAWALVNILVEHGQATPLHVLHLDASRDDVFWLAVASDRRQELDAFIIEGLGSAFRREQMIGYQRMNIPRKGRGIAELHWNLPGLFIMSSEKRTRDVIGKRNEAVEKMRGCLAMFPFLPLPDAADAATSSTAEQDATWRHLKTEAPAMCALAIALHQAQPHNPDGFGVIRYLPACLSPMYQAIESDFIEFGHLPKQLVRAIVMPFLEHEFFEPGEVDTPPEKRIRWSTSIQVVERERIREIRRLQASAEASADWMHQPRLQEQYIYTGNHFTGQRDDALCTILTTDPTKGESSMCMLAKLVPRADFANLDFQPANRDRYDLQARLPHSRHIRLSEFTRVLVGGRLPISALFTRIELELFQSLQ